MPAEENTDFEFTHDGVARAATSRTGCSVNRNWKTPTVLQYTFRVAKPEKSEALQDGRKLVCKQVSRSKVRVYGEWPSSDSALATVLHPGGVKERHGKLQTADDM